MLTKEAACKAFVEWIPAIFHSHVSIKVTKVVPSEQTQRELPFFHSKSLKFKYLRRSPNFHFACLYKERKQNQVCGLFT